MREQRLVHDTDYPAIKSGLVRSAGLSAFDAALQLLSLQTADIASMTVPKPVQRVRRLLKRWVPRATQETKITLLTGFTRHVMPKHARSFLRTRYIVPLSC